MTVARVDDLMVTSFMNNLIKAFHGLVHRLQAMCFKRIIDHGTPSLRSPLTMLLLI